MLAGFLSVLWRSGKRVFGLFLGGYWTWIGITFYVVYDNRKAIAEFFGTGDFLAVVASFGQRLGHADKVILDNTERILSLEAASTQHSIQAFGHTLVTLDLTAFTYLALLGGIIGSLAYIAWYLKAFQKFSELVLAGNAPYLYTMPLALVFYALMIAVVRDINPFVGVITFFQNLDAVLLQHWESVMRNGSLSPGNGSVNSTSGVLVNGSQG